MSEVRLIDANALKAQFSEGAYTVKGIREIIDKAPTVTPDMAQVLAYESGKASAERPTGEWIPVSKELPEKNGFYIVTVSGYGKRPYMKSLGYDAIGKKWGEGGVVAWCNISPYEQEA